MEDYELAFSDRETLRQLRLDQDSGLFRRGIESWELDSSASIPMTRELFEQDALVFTKFHSKRIGLRSRRSQRGVCVDLQGFPYVGLWSKPGAPFVCIEPWFGLADFQDSTGKIENKDGIQRLGTGEEFRCQYEIMIV